MSRSVLLLLAAVGIARSAHAASPTDSTTHPAHAPVDQFIVQFRADARGRPIATDHRATLAAVGRDAGVALTEVRQLGTGASIVRADRPLAAADAAAVLSLFGALAEVEFIQPDRLVGAGGHVLPNARSSDGAQRGIAKPGLFAASTGTGRPAPMLTPDDPLYPQQWPLFDPNAGIRAPAAWDRSTGVGEIVAVLSTGITAHTDLAPNLVAGYDFVSTGGGDGDGRDGDPTDTDACTSEGVFPGTGLAGVVAALGQNGKGIVGVAFGAKVQPIRVRAGCATLESDLADAIVWAAGGSVPGVADNPTPARTVLVDAGDMLTGCRPVAASAVRAAVALGASVVAGGDSYWSCPGLLRVGSFLRAGYPDAYADYADVVAPGGDSTNPLISTTNTGGGDVATEGYGPLTTPGTAAAHVAGIAALVNAISPQPLSPDSMRDLLARTSHSAGCCYAVVDAANAVNSATFKLLGVAAPAVAEGDAGDHVATFVVQLNRPSDVPVTFDFATANGTAVAGSDYEAVALAGQVIAAGETSKSFDVIIHGDAIGEFDESLSGNVSNVTGAYAMGASAMATIVNDDGAVVQLTRGYLQLPPGPEYDRYFRLDVPANARRLSVVVPAFTSISIRFGALPMGSGDIPCWTYGRYSWDSTYCVIDVPQAGSYYLRWSSTTVAPDERDPDLYPGSYLSTDYGDPVTLSVGDASVVEGDGGTRQLTFTATLSEPNQQVAVVFDATTTNGTAGSGVDFQARALTGLSIPAGQLSTTFSVPINGDTTIEPTETFFVNLGNATGANIADGQGIGYIINNDGPLISINDIAVGEGNAGTKVMTFTVSLSKAAAGPVTYTIASAGGDATAGVDYQAINLANQVIPQGQLAKTHGIVINGDTDIEATEVLIANVRQPTGASVWDGQGTGYILNDDGPTLSVLDASVGEGNSDSKVMDITVRLSQAASAPVTFAIATANVSATAGSDYAALNLTGQTIAAGEVAKVFHITVPGDTTVEPNETFTVTLSNPTGASLYDRQAIATIYNNDGPTLSVNDVSVSEGNAGTKVATFNVFLSQVAPAPITFTAATSNVTATAGPDYVARSQSFQLAAGQLSKTFTVTINGDAVVEADETFRVTLSNISAGATLLRYIGTGTITNDD